MSRSTPPLSSTWTSSQPLAAAICSSSGRSSAIRLVACVIVLVVVSAPTKKVGIYPLLTDRSRSGQAGRWIISHPACRCKLLRTKTLPGRSRERRKGGADKERTPREGAAFPRVRALQLAEEVEHVAAPVEALMK